MCLKFIFENLNYLFFEFVLEEKVNDLTLFDGYREFEDFFQRGDFSEFDQSSEFGDWLPFVNFVFGASSLVFSASSASSSEASVFLVLSLIVFLFVSGGHKIFNKLY
jgi:hypothetical protein